MKTRFRIVTLSVAVTLLVLTLTPPITGLADGYKAVGTWEKLAGGGFNGGIVNMMATPFAEFGGSLYCGVASESGAQVRKYVGGAWTVVNSAGFGDTNNMAITSLEAFGSYLYAGTANMNGCQVWRYNGSGWTELVGWDVVGTPGTGPGFGSSANLAATCMEVHDAKLYMGTVNIAYTIIPPSVYSEGAEIWSFDGAVLSNEVDNGFGDTTNADVTTLKEYSGELYAGTMRVNVSLEPGTLNLTIESAGCELRKQGASSWDRIGNQGFGRTGNAAVTMMEPYAGKLFLGTTNGGGVVSMYYDLTTGQLVLTDVTWHSDGCCIYSFNGSLVTEEISGGFGDKTNIAAAASTSVSVSGKSVLLTGVVGMRGTSLQDFYTSGSLRSFNGTDWYRGAADGFGNSRNKAIVSLHTMGGKVYAGTLNPEQGCEVWRGTPPPEPVPVIVSMTPENGKAGTQVIIAGEGFGATQGTSKVIFTAGKEAQVLAWSDVSITCLVPQEAMSGDVVVQTSRGTSNGYTFLVEGYLWFLAEGCTGGDFETYVLVQNPGSTDVSVDLTYMTSTGTVPGPQDYIIPAGTRHTFKANDTVTDWDVSTMVSSTGGEVICERAMYGNNRAWAHDSIGVTAPASTWYLAEGCTGGDFETYVLVQNPGVADVTVDLTYMTSNGSQDGPQDYTIKAGTRHTFKVNDSVTDWDISTMVKSSGGEVICERSMYGGNRTWAHDSIGVTTPGPTWYLAEGCTGGDFETFVLVQNPGSTDAVVDLTFMTSTGSVPGPQDYVIPAGTRHTFKVNDSVTDWDVSTMVTATGSDVICERAMYGGNRNWAHDSIGVTTPGSTWFMAEGCTGGDFETFVLVQNPGSTDVTVDLTFMTSAGSVPGPQDYTIKAGSRHTFKVNDSITDWDVSTMVTASGGKVICERSMYGGNRTWAHDSIGYDP